MKKRFTAATAFIAIILARFLFSCDLFSGNSYDPGGGTTIVFDNSRGVGAVTVYSDSRRREQDVVAREVSPGQSSAAREWPPGESTFHFSYHLGIRGIDNFTLDYVPSDVVMEGQRMARIAEGKRTTVIIPGPEETVMSFDQPLTNNCYIVIRNSSSATFLLHQGSASINPDGFIRPVVNAGERVQYTINPGVGIPYHLLVGYTEVPFPPGLVFEAGRVYSFVYSANFTLSLTAETAVTIANVHGFPSANDPSFGTPFAPGMPVVMPGIGRLYISWNQSIGASSYELYINNSPGIPASPRMGTGETNAVIDNLYNGTRYWVWIKAVNGAGTSAASPMQTGVPAVPTAAPAAPVMPVLTAGSRRLTVSWQPVAMAESYEVWAGTANNPALAVKRGGDIAEGIGEAVITGLENETVYYVWVRARNRVGTSGFSPGVSAMPTAFGTLPVAPSSLAAVISGTGEITLSWPEAEGALSYELWVGTENNSSTAQKRGDHTGTSLIFFVFNDDINNYHFWIKSKNSIGTSGFSPRAITLRYQSILAENVWTDGRISTATGTEQWFKFTATADTQWIHYSPGTLNVVYMSLYDSNGATVGGSRSTLSISSTRFSRTVTRGHEYYIRVLRFNSDDNGTYRIAFNRSSSPPQ